jgi:hypothetical protein
MPATTLGRGNMIYDWLALVTVTWSGTVGATSTAEITATVPGLLVGDYVDMYLQNAGQTTGLTPVNYRVATPNVLTAQFVNSTAGALTPATGPYLMNISRAESYSNLPTNAA